MPENENAGPDFTSFGGAAAAGGIVGTNLLQQVVDKLTRAVGDLSTSSSSLNKAASSMSGAGAGMLGNKGMLSNPQQRGPASSMATGHTTFPKAGQTPGLTGSSGSDDLSRAVSTFSTAVGQFAAAIGKMPSTGSQAGGNGGFPAMGTSQSWSPASSPTFGGTNGGQPAKPYSATSTTGPQAAGGGPPPPAQRATMGGANGGGSNFGTTAVAAAGAAASGLVSGGRSLMPAELSLNQLQYQTAQMGGRPGNFLQQASGAAGVNPIGALGQNAQDQYSQYAILQQMAGNQANPMSTRVGRFGVQGAGFAQMATPTLSATQAAQQTQQMYLPSTSLRMMQSGFGQATPLIPGGGSRSPTAVIQGMLQRGGPSITPGSKQFSQKTLAQFLSPQGEGYAAMQASGIPTSMIPQILTQAKLESGGGGGKPMSPQQVQQLTQQASSGNKAQQAQAYKSMQQAGFPKSDIQSLLNMQASKTAETGAVSGGFNAGVQSFASAVTKFNTAVTHMLQAGGGALGKGVGFGLGAGGSASTFGLPAPLGTAGEIGGIFGLGHMLGSGGGILGKVLGKGVLGKAMGGGKGVLGKVFGAGGGGAGEAAGAGGEAAAAGGVAGGVGLGAVGAAAGGAVAGIPASIGLDKLTKKILPGTMGSVLAALSSATGATLEGPKLIGKLMDKIGSLLKSPLGAAGHLLSDMLSGGKKAVSGLAHEAGAAAGGIGHDIGHAASSAWKGITNVFGGGAAPPGMPKKAGPTGTPVAPTTINPKAAMAVKLAKSQIGVPYKYGMEKQGVGFDCSGLIQWAYQRAGIFLPRTANDQLSFLSGENIAPSKVQEGDVVFTPGSGMNSHEALVVDNGRHIIEAKGPGHPISMRSYMPAEWQNAARPWTPSKKSTSKNKPSRLPANANVRGGGAAPAGYGNPLRGISGLQAQRIDQGVDYAGSGPIFAIGPGKILSTLNSGWPGGAFIVEQLSSGPYAGDYIYYAENIKPTVSAGQSVSDSTTIGIMHGGIEIGWANADVGNSAATAAGQDPKSGDAGGFSTAYGVNMSNFLASLGTPAGKAQGKTSGSVPAGFGKGAGGTPAGAATPAAGTAGALTIGRFASSPSMPGTGGSGMGDTSTEGSTSEKSAFTAAIMGGIKGGSGYYGTSSPTRAITGVSGGGGGATPAPSGGGGAPAGSGTTGVAALAQYLVKAGYSHAAAAGMAGVAGGEGTGAMPEVVGSGGAGLIGWTPPSAMIKFGGTCRAAGIGKNSDAVDMANQEQAMVKWARANGFPPPQAQFPQTLAGAMSAAFAASAAYERPAVRGSDVHANYINQAWAAVGGHATGGTNVTGTKWVGERGPELVQFNQPANVYTAAQSAKLMKAAVAQAPHMAGSGDALVYSTANPIYQGGTGRHASKNGAPVYNLNFGDIKISMPAGSSANPTSPQSARVMAQQFCKQLSQLNLDQAIKTGVNS